MKLICTLFLLFLFLNLEAQQLNKNKVLIGVNFSPDYNYRVLKNNDAKAINDVIIESRNKLEIAKFGYTTGINFLLNCSKHLGLETGIQYSNNGYKTKNQELTFGTPDETQPIKAQFIYSYRYLSIPLKAKYIFGKTKIRVTTAIGFITNLLVNANTKIKYEYTNRKKETQKGHNSSDFKKINLLPVISVGLDFKLCNNMHLMAEPSCRYSLLNTRNAPVTEHLWNLGINVGVYYGLK
jgi:hypothetical protein